MSGQHKLIAAICILSLATGVLALALPGDALGQMTIPTRTPVPGGGGGGNGGGGGGGGGNNNPTPTSESSGGGGDSNQQPTAAATATVPAALPTLTPTTVFLPSATPGATATATPFAVIPAEATATPKASPTADYRVDGLVIVAFPEDSTTFAEAQPCGMPPTFTTSGEISVTGGPSEEYPIVGLLGAGEVRPISGRAAFTDWWVVQLDASGRMGWVSDESGEVNGFVNRVAIVSAPELNGIFPTPGGEPWVPTPAAPCSAAELAAAAVVEVPDSGDFTPPSSEPELPPVALDSADEGQLALTLDDDKKTADPLLDELAASAPPLEQATTEPRLPNLMPVAGAVLVIAAIFVGLFAKRTRSAGTGQE